MAARGNLGGHLLWPGLHDSGADVFQLGHHVRRYRRPPSASRIANGIFPQRSEPFRADPVRFRRLPAQRGANDPAALAVRFLATRSQAVHTGDEAPAVLPAKSCIIVDSDLVRRSACMKCVVIWRRDLDRSSIFTFSATVMVPARQDSHLVEPSCLSTILDEGTRRQVSLLCWAATP